MPDTGHMTGTGIFCAVSIKKGHCYKNFREQDMAYASVLSRIFAFSVQRASVYDEVLNVSVSIYLK